jgi:two-component system cell cycle response regulator
MAAALGIAAALADDRWLAGIASLFAAIGTAIFFTAERAFRESDRHASDLRERVVVLEAELAAERDSHDVLDATMAVPATTAATPTAAADAEAAEPAAEPAPAAAAATPPAPTEVGPESVLADFAAAARAASLNDPITGLFNEQFFLVTLESRISAARRHLRPVAVVLLDVAEGLRDNTGPMAVDPAIVAIGLRSTLREADTACRLPNGQFALILEDTPENGAVWTVERVRRTLAATHPNLTLWAGVACYPAHAFDAGEILERAELALVAAREWRQDRIEVATSE